MLITDKKKCIINDGAEKYYPKLKISLTDSVIVPHGSFRVYVEIDRYVS